MFIHYHRILLYVAIQAKHCTVVHNIIRESYCKCTVYTISAPCLLKKIKIKCCFLFREAVNTLSFLVHSCGLCIQSASLLTPIKDKSDINMMHFYVESLTHG